MMGCDRHCVYLITNRYDMVRIESVVCLALADIPSVCLIVLLIIL